MKKTFFLTVFFLISCLGLSGMPFLAGKSVKIDGELNDGVWQKLPWKGDFYALGSKNKAPVQSRFKTFHNGKYIFFAIECDEPLMAKMRKNPYSYDSGMLWMNDSVEINLVPDSAKVVSFYKWMVDVNGVICDLRAQDDNTNRDKFVTNSKWNSSALIKTRLYKDKWVTECAIPFGCMDYNSSYTDEWRVHVGRNRWASGKMELSASSVLPRKNHMMPKYFNKMKIHSFALQDHLLDVEELKGVLVRKKGRQSYCVSATVHNNSGSFRIFYLTAALKNLQTGKVYSKTQKIHLQRGHYQNYSVTVPDVPNGEYALTLDLGSHRRESALQKRVSQQVTVQYVPLQIKLKRPAYRNNIYASMKDKTIEAVVELREYSGIGIDVELTGPNFRQIKRISRSSGLDPVIFDGSKLTEGRYILRASCVKDGKKLTAEQKIRVLPYRKGEVFLDGRGVPYIDGKEFLSYGWYASYGKPEKMYNTFLNTARFESLPASLRSIRTMYEKYNMKSLVIPFQDLRPGWKWVIFKDPDTRRKGLTEAQKKKIIEFVSVVSKEEGLLGYYMADEPECRDNNPLWYEEARDLIAELDPYHPTFMLNWGIDGMRRYYKGCDILLPDCYPQYFEDGTTSKTRWRPSEYAKVSTSLRPAWQMPQASCWPDLAPDGKTRGVAPSYDDLRSQVFQAIAHNVKGINYYAFFDSQRFTDAILGPPVIGEILAAASSYLLETSVPHGVEVKTVPVFNYFQTGLKIHKGKLLLIAVNTSSKPLQVSFTMKKPFSGKLYTEGCAQTLTVKRGVFTDTFRGNETKLYFSDKAMAQRLEKVEKTLKAIADMKKNRKKAGNLVGLGDMYSIEYILYGNQKKQYGPDTPLIRCSSDARFWMTSKTGSMYYLVDGLTEPKRQEYSWKPEGWDKDPFVEFTLRKKAPVKEVRLYTPCGNLQSGRVVINGRVYPYANSGKSKVIVIPVKEKAMTDKVRIHCTKFSYPKDGDDIDKRLLTEVEIY